MKILSYDCANKSLGYTLFTVDTDQIAQNYLPTGKPTPEKIHAKIREDIDGLNGLVTVESCGVINLFEEMVKDTDIIYRTKKLRGALDAAGFRQMQDIDAVIVEYQYTPGSPSREVSDMLLMYYSDFNIDLFFPSARKKVHFSNDISYDAFSQKYKKSYDANKAHSIANCNYLAEKLNLETFQTCMDGLPASNRDDLAESFMNAWVWVVKSVICVNMQPLHTARVSAERDAKLQAKQHAKLQAKQHANQRKRKVKPTDEQIE